MFFRMSLRAVLVVSAMQFARTAAATPAVEAGGRLPLQVQVSLVSKSTFSQGEPIVLKYRILNASPERVETYRGPEDAAWFNQSFTAVQGHTATVKVEQQSHQRRGTRPTGTSISPESFATGYVVTETATNIQAPGTYTLTVHTRLPYALEAQAEKLSPKKYEVFGDVAVTDFKFVLNVTPHDSRRLKQAAELLRQSVQDAKMRDWSPTAVEALFSMPEADVLPTWQALASDPATPGFVLGFAVSQLARIHSVAASDIVAQLLWDPAQVVGANQSAVYAMALNEMARTGDEKVKKHIDDLYAMHGQTQEYSLEVAD